MQVLKKIRRIQVEQLESVTMGLSEKEYKTLLYALELALEKCPDDEELNIMIAAMENGVKTAA